MQQPMQAAHKLLLEETTTRQKFESIRTLIKGINPTVDKTLTQTSQALADYEKLHKGEVIELTAEKLPENTEEQKKRKKALLFLLKSWKQLLSEVERVQSEFEKEKQEGGKPQDTWSRIVAGAKGPFGIITLGAILIIGFLAFTNDKAPNTAVAPVNTEIPSKHKKLGIEYNSKIIPLSELQARTGPDCTVSGEQVSHYHAKNEVSATATDGTVIPDPGSCAYGKVSEVTVVEIE